MSLIGNWGAKSLRLLLQKSSMSRGSKEPRGIDILQIFNQTLIIYFLPQQLILQEQSLD